MEWLTDWGVWHWLILGFVLLIAEILVPGVFLLWWGLSAIVIAGMTKLIPTLPLSFLAVMYAVIASIFSIINMVKIKSINQKVFLTNGIMQ